MKDEEVTGLQGPVRKGLCAARDPGRQERRRSHKISECASGKEQDLPTLLSYIRNKLSGTFLLTWNHS